MSNTFTDAPEIRLHENDDVTNDQLPFSLPLEITVTDRETIAALYQHEEGEDRDRFAKEALKIGVLAMRHASGVLDASVVQREAAQWMSDIQGMLREHSTTARQRLDGTLRDYFDPESGRFNERVRQLVTDGGELEQVLSKHIAGDDSHLVKTLAGHVGEGSALLKILDPKESEGLFSVLQTTLEKELTGQRDRLLREFSLDEKEGALSRFVGELSERHGKLEKGLSGKIDEIVKEFSFNEEGSSLNRLLNNVEKAHKTISAEFSLSNEESAFSHLKNMLEKTQGAIQQNLTLDDEKSPLSLLKRELLELIDSQGKKNNVFQEEVKVALTKIVATREEAARGTQHGHSFEDAVCEFVMHYAQAQGDIATPTGNQVGLIKNCKVGDCTIELGADSAAPGAVISIEAKEDKSYTQAKAMAELETARKNRGASLGLFVFSSKSAPTAQPPIVRHGDGVFVVWDAENPNTDANLQGGLLVARALSLSEGRSVESREADFKAIDKAILAIEKQAKRQDEIAKKANTIKSSSESILEIVRISGNAFHREIESLRKHIAVLEKALGEGGDS